MPANTANTAAPGPAAISATAPPHDLDAERFIDTVRRMAREALVSERTARRYLERGETPPAGRVLGIDGKLYPRRMGYCDGPAVKSQRAIAKEAGCSQSTVHRVLTRDSKRNGSEMNQVSRDTDKLKGKLDR